MFAALRLIELGLTACRSGTRKKVVRDRKIDIARISREHKVDSESIIVSEKEEQEPFQMVSSIPEAKSGVM